MQSMVKCQGLKREFYKYIRKTKSIRNNRHAVADVVPEAAKGIDIYVNCEENMMIRHDSKWTEEAIIIFDNALKYTEPGGKIHIQTENRNYFLRSAFPILEKGLPRRGRQRSLQDFTVSRRFMINQGLGSDYILQEQSWSFRRAT